MVDVSNYPLEELFYDFSEKNNLLFPEELISSLSLNGNQFHMIFDDITYIQICSEVIREDLGPKSSLNKAYLSQMERVVVYTLLGIIKEEEVKLAAQVSCVKYFNLKKSDHPHGASTPHFVTEGLPRIIRLDENEDYWFVTRPKK